MLRNAQQCDNKHKFCATCAFAWSMTYGANSDKCPVCRSKQHMYSSDVNTDKEISSKWVKCSEIGCSLKCTLKDFLQHSHGIKLFGNGDSSTLDKLRQTRRPAPVASLSAGADILFLPSLGRTNGANGGPVREVRTFRLVPQRS